MFGSFAREIRFPTSTDGTAEKARLVNGVLTLTIPKATTAKASSIPIQAG
jgi:HSP20 family molecular chaperone IbpA